LLANLRRRGQLLQKNRRLEGAGADESTGFVDFIQRRGVDAVAHSGWGGAVVEQVAQVRIAAAAMHFRSLHEKARICFRFNTCFLRRPRKTRPTGSRIELVVGIEQRITAAYAAIDARLLRSVVLAGERRLSAVLPRDPVLLGRELSTPLIVCFMDFVCHVLYTRQRSVRIAILSV